MEVLFIYWHSNAFLSSVRAAYSYPETHFRRKGQSSAVDMILQHGGKAALKDVNKRGLTALGEAILAGHFKIASAMCKVKSMLNVNVSRFHERIFYDTQHYKAPT